MKSTLVSPVEGYSGKSAVDNSYDGEDTCDIWEGKDKMRCEDKRDKRTCRAGS